MLARIREPSLPNHRLDDSSVPTPNLREGLELVRPPQVDDLGSVGSVRVDEKRAATERAATVSERVGRGEAEFEGGAGGGGEADVEDSPLAVFLVPPGEDEVGLVGAGQRRNHQRLKEEKREERVKSTYIDWTEVMGEVVLALHTDERASTSYVVTWDWEVSDFARGKPIP